jgi:tetratricopeptide (TPR) repeat protein
LALSIPARGSELPQAARDAVGRGMAAANSSDFPLAVRYFEEARVIAPEAPVVLFDLALAESHFPGRELRAIAWYAAYLSVQPAASNAAAVKTEIARLRSADRKSLLRVMKSAEEAATTLGAGLSMMLVAKTECLARDVASALRTASRIEYPPYRSTAYTAIAICQAESGDIPSARATLDRIEDAADKYEVQAEIVRILAASGDIGVARATWREMSATVEPGWRQYVLDSPAAAISAAQVQSGDRPSARETIATALENAKLVADPRRRDFVFSDLARAMARNGDIGGARQTADLIKDASYRAGVLGNVAAAVARAGDVANALELASTLMVEDEYGSHYQDQARELIAEVQAARGDLAGARETVALIKHPFTKNRSLAAIAAIAETTAPKPRPVERWLALLDAKAPASDCALKMPIFLDLPAHLKALPADDLDKMTDALLNTANRMARAGRVVDGLLREQGLIFP